MNSPVLEVSGLSKVFTARRAGLGRTHDATRAVDDVSFAVGRSERLGIVGESGSGKTTLARTIAGLVRPTAGSVRFAGTDLTTIGDRDLRRIRARLQLVVQDPLASLDPRMSVRQIVREGLEIHGLLDDAEARVAEVLDQVGIASELHGRRPYALSGGQRQRVALARSIVLSPELVVLDEPVSALDVSVQGQILNLLRDLQDAHQLTYVFIVHDLSVARWFCDRIAVMYRGRIVELATSAQLFESPRHPYTRELLDAVPGGGGSTPPWIVGSAPAEGGCAYRHRCVVGRDRARCAAERPQLTGDAEAHQAACHFPGEVAGGAPVELAAPSGVDGGRPQL